MQKNQETDSSMIACYTLRKHSGKRLPPQLSVISWTFHQEFRRCLRRKPLLTDSLRKLCNMHRTCTACPIRVRGFERISSHITREHRHTDTGSHTT